MCGICGVVNQTGDRPLISEGRFLSMRESLTHRGPDDAGLFTGPSVLLGHRRLTVVDRSEAGRQPMVTPDGRFVLVYNGELYNDRELRRELESEGIEFRSACDSETVLHAVAHWGADASERMRGMYALALWDCAERVLLLGRDPFGMKPLCWALAGNDIVFASEAHAMFDHPGLRPLPDESVVSSYISTVRETLGDRTMFAGVRTVRPGEWLRFETGRGLKAAPERIWGGHSLRQPADQFDVSDAVSSSVRAHLRSDVPWCSLLSGGLDSTIVAAVASEELRGSGAPPLRTYVSGCLDAGEGLADDFGFAREASDHIGTAHREVPVDQGMFIDDWAWIVERTGLPLTTPNTVAILSVARALRADGCVVALSGEGADELFGGYELPLTNMAAYIAGSATDTGGRGDAAYALSSTAWIQPQQKAEFLNAEFWIEADRDALLLREHKEVIARSLRGARAWHPGAPSEEHRLMAYLGFQRSLNLTGLLQRLDSATMLASVEGRTPFADRVVASSAEQLRIGERFHPGVEGSPTRSKIALRDAFRARVPSSIADRPKRSFPLPFAQWLGDVGGLVRSSPLVGRVYSPVAIEVALADPASWWHVVWPMANLARWDRRWWGS